MDGEFGHCMIFAGSMLVVAMVKKRAGEAKGAGRIEKWVTGYDEKKKKNTRIPSKSRPQNSPNHRCDFFTGHMYIANQSSTFPITI
jgi:hypothetical protein